MVKILKHINFVKDLCKGPVLSNSENNRSYRYLKNKNLNIHATLIQRNTNPRKNKSKYLKDTQKFKVYWIDGFELETIKMLHDLLGYERTEWRYIYTPVMGRDKTNIIKAANKIKPTKKSVALADMTFNELKEIKRKNIRYFTEWINSTITT
jgi:hypothetical protein